MGLEELLTEIAERVDQECLSTSCSGDGCRVYLEDVPPSRIIVDLECEFKRRKIDTKRCDYVLFYADTTQNILVVVLIELKSGTFKTTDVSEQLQKAADFVMEIFGSLSQGSDTVLKTLKIRCVPVLFHGRGIDKSQLYRLESAKVRFRSRNIGIRRSKCAQTRNLARVLLNNTV